MGINFLNLDLLSVGIAVAATGILGLSVFLSNRESITNRVFFIFSFITICWGIANYLQYNIYNVELAFWLLKISVFFATLQAYFIFLFLNVFPRAQMEAPVWLKVFVVPIVAVTAIATLTPLVFSGIAELSPEGIITKVHNGPGLPLFGTVAVGLVMLGIAVFARKVKIANQDDRKKFIPVLIGLALTFSLIITFNFIFPAILEDSRFISLGALFLFPFIVFTSYAIMRHGLLNVKVIATEILVFILAVASLVDVITATEIKTIIVRAGVFVLVLIVGMFLIRSVRKEVEQKEELRTLSESLAAANEQLKRTEKLKAEFFSFAAHQVKSPMAVIKGYATLIGDGTLAGAPADKIVEIAKKIGTAASRTLTMVNNLLDMRKIEEGRMVYSFEQVNVVPPIRTIVADLETLAKDKGLALTFETSQEEIMLNMDMQKFAQVVQNLIDNSVKYTDTGWVKVAVKLSDGKALFTVSDSGRGISKDFAANMFTQFARDPALAQDTKGTGLGLFIAKQIVEAHGGRIWAASEGEGAGSTFSVEIPVDNKAVTEKMGS